MTETILLGLGSTFLFGLRHGVDYDHVAAITDLTGLERDRASAFRLGMIYAFGHACVIIVLGAAAIAFGTILPPSLDAITERVVGATLVVLGIYVVWSLLRRPAVLPVTRIRIIQRVLGSRWTVSGKRGAFIIGMLHGVGAETPTQLGLFLFAAGVGGQLYGALGLCLFVSGLLVTNAIMCLVATRALHTHDLKWRRRLLGISAAYSLAVGVTFLLA